MPSMSIGDWFGWNCSPAAKAEALAGIIKNAPPVAIMVVTIKHATAESTGNSINWLSERRMAKLCLTSTQLRENLPIAPSHANKRTRKRRNCNLGIAWRSEFPAPIVRPMHSLGTGNASDKSVLDGPVTAPPVFFVSVASKGFNRCVSLLFATLEHWNYALGRLTLPIRSGRDLYASSVIIRPLD